MAQSDKEVLSVKVDQRLAERFNKYRGDSSKNQALQSLLEASLNAKEGLALQLGERLLFMSIFIAIVGIPLPVLSLMEVATMTVSMVVLGILCIGYALRGFSPEAPTQ